MKEVVGILIFVCVAVISLFLFVTKRQEALAVCGLIIVGAVCGFIAANYDVISRLKYKDLELETFRKEVAEVKSEAMEELKAESKLQKVAITSLLDDAESTKKKIEDHTVKLEQVIAEAKETAADLVPRFFTNMAASTAALKPFSGTRVAVFCMLPHDPEVKSTAAQIRAALVSAGWRLLQPGGVSVPTWAMKSSGSGSQMHLDDPLDLIPALFEHPESFGALPVNGISVIMNWHHRPNGDEYQRYERAAATLVRECNDRRIWASFSNDGSFRDDAELIILVLVGNKPVGHEKETKLKDIEWQESRGPILNALGKRPDPAAK